MLSKQAFAKIDQEIAKYPSSAKRSAVMSALRIAQTEKGWLDQDTIQCIADYLQMPPIAVHEVATFYHMYYLHPVGRYTLTICTNLSCALQGGVQAADYLKKKLNIGFGETTSDGKFTLLESECMGACGDAPVMLINNHQLCGLMTPEAIDKKLTELE
ncbi:MAG: NADH-quinone oxidoreductase subunit NuoE [Neisseriales bacterium]|nr:MAG: NADH-quinone oxidoreductase subunit NuoE [Neisseriales bacterium]